VDSIVHTVIGGDRNVLKGIAVTVRSALENSSVPLGVNLLATGWYESDLKNLRQSWNHENLAYVRTIDVPFQHLRSFRSTAYLKSKAAYARYFMGRIPDAKRIVYLDSDLLVCLDLAETGAIDLQGRALAVVRDVSVRIGIDSQKSRERLEKRLGLRNGADYFNSGFLIVDLDRWRKVDAEGRLVQLSIDRFDTLDSQDQDALNVIFEDDVKFLDDRWNLSQYEFNLRPEPRPDACIIHLIGTVKPWHADYNYMFKDEFNSVLSRTAYAGQPPDNVALSRKIPTIDMIIGKIRRAIRGARSAQ
jgi:lipopolysaccharide biosynthesis glycosyltransferase